MNAYTEYTSLDDLKIKAYYANGHGFSAMQMGYTGEISFYSKNGAVTANEQVNTAANTVLKILPTGKIGLGTTTPSANLQIGEATMKGLLNLSGYAFVGSLKSSGDFFAGMNAYAEYTSSDDLKIKAYYANGHGFSALQMGYTGEINFYSKSGSVVANEQVNVPANNVFKITSAGNVGIGTTTPDSKLTVKGDIHTREVKVDLNGAVGPDYVFEPDYNLLSLSELETYITHNKHLPEVPSAKEMEKEGLNLKEMNLLLLRKIEELTLHLIEQNKTIADLKEKTSSPDLLVKKVWRS